MSTKLILSTINIVCSIAVVVQLTKFTQRMNDITVYDIDLARQQLLEETQYAFMQGCRGGVDRYASPAELQDWSADSPMNFCDKAREEFITDIDSTLIKLGRKK